MPTGCRDYASDEAELVAWIDVLGWAAGDGPEVIVADAVTWLRERWVLLPGVTTLARLLARVRARISPVASSVPEPVMNASSLIFQGWADDLDCTLAVREYVPAGQRHGWIVLVAAGEFQQSRLGQTVDDPADATPVDRARAHRARLCAGVHRARAQVSTVEPPARDTHQVRFRVPGYVVLGDDGVFRLGDDDAISVDQERTKRVVSAAPGAPGQVYAGMASCTHVQRRSRSRR